MYGLRFFPHNLSKGSYLIYGFTFKPECHKKSSYLGWCGFTGHNLIHDLSCLNYGKVFFVDKLRNRLLNHLIILKRFSISFPPTGVRIDSGWNCTPITLNSLSLTAMTRSLLLLAETSRQYGIS